MAKRRAPAAQAPEVPEEDAPSVQIGSRRLVAPQASDPEAAHNVWSRNGGEPKSGIARVWDAFLDGKEACFWGLTYDEGLLARRLASKPSIAADYTSELKLDEDLLPIVYVMMSARGGDTDEYAYDPAAKAARTLLEYRNPQDQEILKAGMGGAWIRLMATQVERLSVVSMPRISEYLGFFQITTVTLSGCLGSLCPSIREVLSASFDEEAVPMRNLRLMENHLRNLSDLAATLQLG